MKLKLTIVAILLCLTTMGNIASAENIELTFHEGRVTIIASKIPLDKILSEWSRLGNTTFITADEISDRLISVTLINVTEGEALEVLLREIAGYLLAPKPLGRIGTSIYDRVFLMLTDNVETSHLPPLVVDTARSLQIDTDEPSSSIVQLESGENLELEELDDLALLEQLRNRRQNLETNNEAILDFPTFLPRDTNQDSGNKPEFSSRPGVIVNTEESSSRPRRRQSGTEFLRRNNNP